MTSFRITGGGDQYCCSAGCRNMKSLCHLTGPPAFTWAWLASCLFARISWEISQLTALPIISHTAGTVGLSFDPLMLSHAEGTTHPVP